MIFFSLDRSVMGSSPDMRRTMRLCFRAILYVKSLYASACSHSAIVSMKARYQYRIYPKSHQLEPLAQAFGCSRVVWSASRSSETYTYRGIDGSW